LFAGFRGLLGTVGCVPEKRGWIGSNRWRAQQRTSARCAETSRSTLERTPGGDASEFERTWGVQADILEHADSLPEAGLQHLILGVGVGVGVGVGGDGYDLSVPRQLVAWRDN
jgi:hypothetical protein